MKTNGQPWALPGIMYAVHLISTNGVPVVAERSISGRALLPISGLGALIGQAQPADEWLLPGHVRYGPHEAPGPGVARGGQSRGQKSAMLNIEALTAATWPRPSGLPPLGVKAGGRTGLELPAGTADEALVVKSSSARRRGRRLLGHIAAGGHQPVAGGGAG